MTKSKWHVMNDIESMGLDLVGPSLLDAKTLNIGACVRRGVYTMVVFHLRSPGSPYPSNDTSISLDMESGLRVSITNTHSNIGMLYEYFILSKSMVNGTGHSR